MNEPTPAPERRMTKQRAAVLADLEGNRHFRSAQEIFDHLRSDGHSVGLATVYRNLQALHDGGDVDTVRNADGEALFRLCVSEGHHHHLVCRNCGHTEEISADEIAGVEAWAAGVAASHGFTEPSHAIELQGLCATCSAGEG